MPGAASFQQPVICCLCHMNYHTAPPPQAHTYCSICHWILGCVRCPVAGVWPTHSRLIVQPSGLLIPPDCWFLSAVWGAQSENGHITTGAFLCHPFANTPVNTAVNTDATLLLLLIMEHFISPAFTPTSSCGLWFLCKCCNYNRHFQHNISQLPALL